MINRRHFTAILGTSLAVGTPAFSASGAAAFNGGVIEWKSYDAGLRKARSTDKPVFLLVHANWCGACRRYRKVFFDKQVETLSKKYIFVLVDTDQQPEISRKYAADGGYIPRSMILNPDGTHRAQATSGHPQYKYYLNPDDPSDLIGFLKKNA